MKNLSKFCVRVTTADERRNACQFFQRASHKPKHPYCSNHGSLVGIGRDMGITTGKKFVTCGSVPYPSETVIPFAAIALLADTKSRQIAFNKVFGKTFDI